MIYQSKQNPFSHLTVKERKWPSFPTKHLFQKGLLNGRVLDFGCGLGIDTEFLRKNVFDITAYDPYYNPEYPQGKFDTIICNYVLNVLLPDEQEHVLMSVAELLKPQGKAYFSVRRGIKKSGYSYNKKLNCNVYECDVKLPYKSILETEHCEIYEYIQYNQLRNQNNNCIFCNPESERELITESSTSYAILDKYPVSLGHTLVIPKNHLSDYFGLSSEEQMSCWTMVNKAKKILDKQFNPNGFNIGVNISSVAGQTVAHAHIHLIPRYIGDVNNPVGGIRNIIPEKANYLNTSN